jgi:hypothetical protein
VTLRRAAVVFALAASALLPVAAPTVVAAQTGGDCVVDPVTITCDAQVERPERPSGPRPGTGVPDDEDDGSGPSGPVVQEPRDLTGVETECSWQNVGGPVADSLRGRMTGVPDGAVFQIPVGCDYAELGDADPLNQARWVMPGDDAPPAPADPAVVAEGVLAQIQTRMNAPAVVSDPPLGTASVVTLPVFVQVTNWQGTVSDSGCDGPVCVEITATPTLTFDPGEPGSSAKVCTPPGTRFDPGGPDPVDQASAAGACAHVYTSRTGALDRPAEWPAQVTITWDVGWTSNVGVDGAFDPMSLSTAVPRAVNEVQTVVVG